MVFNCKFTIAPKVTSNANMKFRQDLFYNGYGENKHQTRKENVLISACHQKCCIGHKKIPNMYIQFIHKKRAKKCRQTHKKGNK